MIQAIAQLSVIAAMRLTAAPSIAAKEIKRPRQREKKTARAEIKIVRANFKTAKWKLTLKPLENPGSNTLI